MSINNLSKTLNMSWHLHSIKKKKIKADNLLTLFKIDEQKCLWNDAHPNRLTKIAYQRKYIDLIDGYFVINSGGERFIKETKKGLQNLLDRFNEDE
jgi:hypothetical protein